MFCRGCRANLPDGTPRCPKCGGDPRVPPPEVPEPAGPAAPRPAGGPGRAVAPPRAAGPRPAEASARAPAPPHAAALGRLNLALAAIVLVGIAGPPLARWWTARAPAPPAFRPVATGPATAEPAGPEPAVVAPPPPIAGGAADDPAARLGREAYALYQQGQVAAACQRYAELTARGGGDGARRSLAACEARLGRDAYQAGRAAEAAEHYRRAVEAEPARDHWLGVVLAEARAGDLAQAQRSAEQALRAFPDDPELLYLVAELLERQGRAREALEAVRRLLARDAGHPRGRLLLARLEREQRVEGDYWSQESAHFVVRYEGAQGIDLGRSVVDVLEDAYRSVGRDLGAYPRERVQVGIYSTRVLGEVIGVPAHYIRGAFDGQKLRLNLAESVAYSNDLARLVRHEYTHLVIHLASNGRAPIWLHEGLAQVMEPRPAPRFVEIEVPRQYLTLGGIERLGRTLSDPLAFTAGYELMHVAAEYLVDRGGMAGMRELLARLGKGETVGEALRHAFGFGPEEVEARLLAAGGRS